MNNLLQSAFREQGTGSIRLFERRYAMALLALGALSLATFLLLQWSISTNAADPLVVNAAGRQRMLSQRIAMHTALLNDPMLSSSERERQEAQLEQDTHDLEHLLEGLVHGDPELGLTGQLSQPLQALYFEEPLHLQQQTLDFLARAEGALAHSRAEGMLLIGDIGVVGLADRLIVGQEQAVRLFEAQATQHLTLTRWLNAGLFGLMLGTLIVVWQWVFRPISRLLLEEERALREAARLREKETRQQTFQRQLTDALDIIDNEADLMGLLERALATGPAQPTELLLADSSNAHMVRVAAHPVAGVPGCGVETPRKCAAVRRGRSILFRSSEDLDACPRLRAREDGACGALCVPISFMGRAMGVLHTTGPELSVVSDEHRHRNEQIAGVIGARLGSIRSFEQVQLQATTDPLTGLLNRRALEAEVRKLVLKEDHFAVAIADLDHFKRLNDTHGHEAGDRALSTFSKVVREVVRDGDLVARFGGEEFVIVFPRCKAEQAARTLERVRNHLAKVTAGSDTPTFTASYGVSDSRCGFDLQGLVQVADAALMRAKTEGRDRILIADMGEPDAAPPPILRPDERVA